MTNALTQLIAVVAAPLPTLLGTGAVARAASLGDEATKAVGATLAALVIFGLTQLSEGLPRWSGWYRRRFDSRAAFEGWWLQIHEKTDRVAVFSFLYASASDAFRAEGNAFDSAGLLLAHWKSTKVFFADDELTASYLWEGKSDEGSQLTDRKGTTALSLQGSQRRTEPISGHGEVLHLNQDRTLTFRLQRVTRDTLRACLEREVTDVEDLRNFELQRELAMAYLKNKESVTTGVSLAHA